MSHRIAGTTFLLTAMLLLASGCGNDRDFSRGEMKPYLAERAEVRADVADDARDQARLPARR